MTERTTYDIQLPQSENGRLDQDEEYCLVKVDGSRRRLRFHDYAEIYRLPGLYEQIFYEELECSSPPTVVGLLSEALDEADVQAGDLTALDVGAGNGMVGEELARIGIGSLVGVDILPEAAEAAERDRPDLYDEYLVVDLTDLPAEASEELEQRQPNVLTCVAALGYGDMPPEAFATAYDLLPTGGYIAFCIKDTFLDGDREQESGFARLVSWLRERGMIAIRCERRYRHRLSVSGRPLHYIALVAVKRTDGPAAPLAAEL